MGEHQPESGLGVSVQQDRQARPDEDSYSAGTVIDVEEDSLDQEKGNDELPWDIDCTQQEDGDDGNDDFFADPGKY